MATCKDCVHGEICERFAGARTLLCGDKADERCKMFKPTADVAPKSEVARGIFAEIYEDCFNQFGYLDYDALDKLKKKYTEEQT